ncbi:hypothetical protein S7711_10838 [Stachybotrys chartarum IBT 7711]|uniref:CBM-cenC domain-containing protein n=1 Tax=Stachybotrys chartarum (strain CBS 109288 / IBT 7711) TaxID=1280523 RepID=A0A084B5K6_STACB|nr:hypothetical protein S7711_10838 [Stachybotrys chartarum IBT 7711]
MLALHAAVLLSALPMAIAQRCNADNCYRGLLRIQSTATAFCRDYLDHVTEAPSPIATCGPNRLSSACSCIVTATTVPSPGPTNLVINGGFETGDLSPWTVVTPSGYVDVTDNSESTEYFPFRARTGTKFAQIGNPGDETPDSLSQSVSLLAGTTYTFSAYYSVLDLPLDSCHIRAVIAGTTVVEDLIYAGSGGGNPPGYYRITGTYTSPATGPSDLSVELWCDMYSLGGVFGLDDVSLV